MMHRWVTLFALIGLLSGCVTQTVKTTSVPTLATYESELSSDEILDIAVAVFDPGISETEINDSIYPEIRRAEALSEDLFAIPPQRISTVQVEQTFIDGKRVYSN